MSANLLRHRTLRAFLTSGLYPAIFQTVTAAFFVVVIWQLFVGPTAAHDNLGTALTWVLWWPIIPIVFVVLGRFWCAICPFGTLSDLVQKVVGQRQPVPLFLKRYGIWVIDALFIFITWADHIWGIVDNPWGSGMLLLALSAGVIASGVLFARRTWCRYLCFLGGLAGNYARAGIVALRADQEICATCKGKAACYNGNDKGPGCPMFEFPRRMDSNARCTLCAACLKTCPHDALQLKIRPPTQELWLIREPKFEEAFLAIVIMGIVFVQNVTMLEVWNALLLALQQVTGTASYVVNFTITFLMAMAIPLALFGLAAWVASRLNGETYAGNFAKFGYAIIPLDIAGHMGHNLFHLLAEGKAVVFTAQAVLGQSATSGSAALLPTPTIQVLQYVLLGMGAVGSLYVVYAIGRNQFGQTKGWGWFASYGVLIGVFLSINVWLFALPMSMRMHGGHAHPGEDSSAAHAHTTAGLNDDHTHAPDEANQAHEHTTSDLSGSHTHDDPTQWYDEPEQVGWPRKVNMEAIFPPGEGRDLVLYVCTSCHSFVRIVIGHHGHSHGTEEGKDTHWDVHRILHGHRLVHLTGQERDQLYGYLKENFNDKKPAPKLPSWLREYW